MSLLQNLVHVCLEKNLNFVVFRHPNSPHFEIIIENHLVCGHTKSGFVFAPFIENSSHPSVFIPADFWINEELVTKQFIDDINSLQSIPKKTKNQSVEHLSREKYIDLLQQGIDELKRNKLDKFIFSRVKSITRPNLLNLTNFFFRLSNERKDAFVYMINQQYCGTWLGASPETLAAFENGIIRTMSLAGTRPNNNQGGKWTAKEFEEQDYVTRYIENIFFASNITCQVGKVKTVSAGPVLHLKTDIFSAQTLDYHLALSLAKKLHPTPAVCGTPLKKALELIHRLEPHNRNYYSGYLGVVQPEKKFILYVNLRCLEVFSQYLALYVGGGITAKSDARKEWEETEHKATTLLEVM